MSKESANFILASSAVVAASSVFALASLQHDAVSRFILSDEKLQHKRQAEFKYRWENSLEKGIYALRRKLDYLNDTDQEKLDIEFIHADDDIKNFINTKIFIDGGKSKEPPNVDIVSIELDKDDKRNEKEYFIYLLVDGKAKYQLPLIKFCLFLYDIFEEKFITSTTLCFVSDASAGKASYYINTLLSQALERNTYRIIREPLWMALLTNIIHKRLILDQSKIQKVVYALCRLSAWSSTYGCPKDEMKLIKTVVFFLPGQIVTPTLIPILQQVFPCERHVFAYDSCKSSVEHGMRIRTGDGSTSIIQPSVKEYYKDEHQLSSVVSGTTPLQQIPKYKVRNIVGLYKNVTLREVDTIQSWMVAADAFLTMKSEDEKKNEYLPFVFKLSNVVDEKNGSLDDKTHSNARCLALINLIQYITGSRSRPLSSGVVDAAIESLRDLCTREDEIKKREEKKPLLSPGSVKAIEDCVFCHKLILIQDKTLPDTVKPSKEWTLKAASKISGCLCCGPEEDEDEEEEERMRKASSSNLSDNGNGNASNINMAMPGAFAMAFKDNNGNGAGTATGTGTTSSTGGSKRPKYVDGAQGFAFDPTKF